MATANSKLKIDFGFDSLGTSNVVGDMEITGSLLVGGNLSFSGTSTGNFLPDQDQRSLGNTVNRWNLQGFVANIASTLTVAGSTTLQDTLAVTKTISSGNVTVTGFANVTTSVNSALITVGTNFIANTLGVHHTGTVNAASFTTSGIRANTTALVPTSNTILLGNTIGRWVLNANTGNFSGALSVTGSTILSNSLSVAGNSTFTSNATLNGSLQTISGNSNFDSGVLFVDAVNNRVGINNISPGVALVVTGATDISSTANVQGNANVGGTLGVSGLTTLAANVILDGTLQTISGNSNFDSGVLFVDAINNRVGINNTAPGVALRVTGDVDISSTVNVQSNADVGGALGVAGLTTLAANATLNGSLQTIAGNANFDSGVLFVDAVNNRVGINNTVPGVALVVAGAANVSTSVNSALLTVGTNFVANTTGAYHTGTVNAASFTTTGIRANTTALVPTSNTILLGNTIGRWVVSANSITTAGIVANQSGVFPSSNSVGTALGNTLARWVLTANTGDFSVGVGSGTINSTSKGFFANSTTISVGDAVNNVSITATGMTISVIDGLKPFSNISGHVLGSALQRWDLTASNGNFSHNVTIGGNLTVSGTTTYINTTNLEVGDNIVTLNADIASNVAPSENAGLEINRGSSANVSFIWNEATDAWNLGNTSVTGAVTATTISTLGYQANATALNPTSNTILLGNTIGRWVITANSFTTSGSGSVGTTLSAGNTTITGFANASVSVNSALLTVGTSFTANTSGAYHTGTINAASFTTTNFLANTTGAYPLSNTAGTALGNTTRRWVLTANTGTFSGALSVTGTTTITTLTANGSTGTAGQVLLSGAGTNAYWGAAGITISNDTSTNATRYLLFNESTTGSTSNAGVSSTKLTFNPSSGILSAVEFSATSDERLKSEVSTISNALEVVSNLRGVNYVFTESGKKNIGVIAQEVELVIPEVVNEDQNGYKSVNYGNIVGLLIEAIKELKQEIKELKNGNQS